MAYEDFSTEDFIQDTQFRQWVLRPDRASNRFWHEFLTRNPEKLPAIKQAKQLLLSLKFPEVELSDEDKAQLWNNIRQVNLSPPADPADYRKEIPLNPIAIADHERRKQSGRRSSKRLRVAASLAGLLGLGILAYFLLDGGLSYDVYRTAYGETKTIVLPDGSSVVLNANTTLKVPSEWEAAAPREAWLRGEAFFDVEKQLRHTPDSLKKRRKFWVHTKNLKVEVLGTAFNVNTRRHKTQVVLNTGKVKLIDKHRNELTISPGELAELSENRSTFVKKVVDTAPYSSWKENKLICDGTTLDEIARIMHDRFGVEVQLANPDLAKVEASGTIPLDDLTVFLTVMQKSINVDIIQQGDRVIIQKKYRQD